MGRSLDAPMESAEPAAPVAPQPQDAHSSVDSEGQRWLDLGVIEPNPYQPRKNFDEEEIADLADSIREHGVLQPLVVRKVDDRFELVAGERRLRAAQAAGWDRVPVQLRDLSDQQTAELAIVENVQRKDLNAIEKATSFQRYLDQYGGTQEELAKRVHINRSTVANLIRLLELPEGIQRMVVGGEISQGHARALLTLADSEAQTKLAKKVVSEGLSVRKVEQAVQDQALEAADQGLRVVGDDGVSRQPGATRSAQIESLEQQLQAALGTRVELRQNAKGKGRITIHFANADEFERLQGVLAPQNASSTGDWSGSDASIAATN